MTVELSIKVTMFMIFKRTQDVLFLKNDGLSQIKIGLLPIFILNYGFGLSIVEVGGRPRPKTSLIVLTLSWSIYSYFYKFMFWDEYSSGVIENGLSHFKFSLLSAYYIVANVIFASCAGLSLYHSNVIIDSK